MQPFLSCLTSSRRRSVSARSIGSPSSRPRRSEPWRDFKHARDHHDCDDQTTISNGFIGFALRWRCAACRAALRLVGGLRPGVRNDLLEHRSRASTAHCWRHIAPAFSMRAGPRPPVSLLIGTSEEQIANQPGSERQDNEIDDSLVGNIRRFLPLSRSVRRSPAPAAMAGR